MLDKDRIIVVDGHPGQGKTEYAIQMINSSIDEDEVFIFVTPYLEEVKRIIRDCKYANFIQPEIKYGAGVKRDHLLKLVRSKVNIATTHSLFQNIDNELIEALRLSNYTLILDEVFEVIEPFDLYNDIKRIDKKTKEDNTRRDIQSLINKGYIEVRDDFRVTWADKEVLKKYESLKNLADRDLLYFINDSLLLWSFPAEIFREGIFEKIYILTYQFESQVQAHYYKFFDIEYSKWHIDKVNNRYTLVATTVADNHEANWKTKVKSLIRILDNAKMNRIGDVYRNAVNVRVKAALSKAWYENNPTSVTTIRDNVINFFENIHKTKASDKFWTTFINNKKQFIHKKLSRKQFVPLNARATNDYRDRHYLAYCINRYLNPYYVHFFAKKNITVDQDKIALAEMIQWIWRSAIREGDEIWVYIPSERMRTLLQKFLNDEEVVF